MNFFTYYNNHTKESEPPKNFHFWTAIGVISALLGRKCYATTTQHYTTFPQLYIILVGPPSTGKSTALDIGEQLTRGIENFPLTPSSLSRESLLEVMEENKVDYSVDGRNYFYHQAATFATELKGFIGGKHLNESLIEIMTTLWNKDFFEYRPKNSKKTKFDNPFFTILGCCTIEWLKENLKKDLITDGFARRTIFVVENQPFQLNPLSERNSSFNQNYNTLITEIERLSNIKGKFLLTKKAQEVYIDVYKNYKGKAHEQEKNLQSYYSTRPELTLKTAICLSASIDSTMVIDSEIMKLASLALEQTEITLGEIYGAMGRNELKPYSEQVFDFISEQKQVSNADLLDKFNQDLRIGEYGEVVETLIKTNRIVAIEGGFKCKTKSSKKKTKNMLELLSSYKKPKDEVIVETSNVHEDVLVSTNQKKFENTINERIKNLKKGILIKRKL